MRNQRSVVLAYHALGSAPADAPLRNTFVTPELFESHMAFLAERRRVVGLDEILGEPASSGPPRVAITFDDGYRSVLAAAVPALERHGFPATVFVPTAWLGDRNRWDPEDGLELDLMSGEELVEIRDRGFEVASHGHRHLDLSRATDDEVREDLQSSVRCLTELLGSPPRYLSYPYGRSSEGARRAVREAGFREAFALEWEDGPFARSRTPVFPRDSAWRYAFKSSGRYAGLRRSRPVAIAYSLLRPLLRRPR